MKKILLLMILLFPIVFYSDNVNALTMNVKGEEVEVTEENFINYLYQNYRIVFNYDYTFLVRFSSGTIRVIGTNNPIPLQPSTTTSGTYNLKFSSGTNGSWYQFDSEFNYKSSSINVNLSTAVSSVVEIIETNYSVYEYDGSTSSTKLLFPVTFNNQELEDYFSSSSAITNIEFPFNKNEYYTLLVLLGTLIMMQFLKWCFPFKGGQDVK